MVTRITKPRRAGRRSMAFVACLVSMGVIAAACGSSETSADQARELLMERLTASGFSADVATCIVDEALERFEPRELVNASGEATAEVEAGVGDIVITCSTPETTVPEATIPLTAVPRTTVPETTIVVPEATMPGTTVPDVDLTSFCLSSEAVHIGLLAGDAFEDPAPATIEAFLAELIDRIELAIVTAPNSEFAVQPTELLAAIQSLDAVLASNDYDVSLVPDEELTEENDVVNGVRAELEAFLEDCDTGTDVQAEASALAEQLTALGVDQLPPTDTDTRGADSIEVLISSEVPATWTSELSETVDDRRIFIVATDAEGFKTSWGVDGVRFTGVNSTVDYVPLMDDSDAARECTLLAEEDFEGNLYVGKLRRYESCGENTEAVVIGANRIGGEGTAVVELQMVEFDEAILALIAESFEV